MSNLITEVNDNLAGRGPSVRHIDESNMGKPINEAEPVTDKEADRLTNVKYPSCEDEQK